MRSDRDLRRAWRVLRAASAPRATAGAAHPFRFAVRVAAALIVGALISSCGSEKRQTTRAPLVIDERTGTIEGVGIGDSSRKIQRALGRRAVLGDVRAFPDNLGATGDSMVFPNDAGPRHRVLTLRFGDRSFILTRATGVVGAVIWNPDARTRPGVRIGDQLDLVRKRYTETRCGEEIVDDNQTVPSCVVRVGNIKVTFAKDPIRSITLASQPVR